MRGKELAAHYRSGESPSLQEGVLQAMGRREYLEEHLPELRAIKKAPKALKDPEIRLIWIGS